MSNCVYFIDWHFAKRFILKIFKRIDIQMKLKINCANKVFTSVSENEK